jgi:DNA-binding GntR family transcriptional regulator
VASGSRDWLSRRNPCISSALVEFSKQQRVYSTLKSRIIGGTYGPGFRLVLDALARELDVSQIPVREAIRRLEAEGWIEYTRNVGASVKRLDAAAIEQTLHTLALLEGYATSVAAPKVRATDLVRARELNRQMTGLRGSLDPVEFSAVNRSFHFTILNRCPSGLLMDQVTQAWDRLDAMQPSLFIYIPYRAEHSVTEHEAILKLIETGADAVEIELAAREHKLHLVDAIRVIERAKAQREAALA